MGKPLYVDKSECTSCNLCTDTVPAVFRMDDDDLAEVIDSYDGVDEDEIQTAIDDCPAECILWGKTQAEWDAEQE